MKALHFHQCLISVLSASVLHCGGDSGQTGGLTARLHYEGESQSIVRQGLRTATPPPEIDVLLISVLDVNGATLAATRLSIDGAADMKLNREGGTWSIQDVPVGINHTLLAQAFFGNEIADAKQRGRLAFVGRKRNLRVQSGITTDAGLILMKTAPQARIPRLDRNAPKIFKRMSVASIPEGNGLEISLDAPDDTDFAGTLIAISTSSTAQAGLLTRGSSVTEGRALDGSDPSTIVRVISYGNDAMTTFRIYDLAENQSYQLSAYAFDLDLEGQPLNFSIPISRRGTPVDTVNPGLAQNITVTASISGWFQLTFSGPGEDDQVGTVSGYEIKAGFEQTALADPAQFENFAATLSPPPAIAPGLTSTVVARFDDLGLSESDDFFIAIRAFDAAGNIGAIAVAAYTLSPTIAPIITQLSPAIGMLNSSLTIDGSRFGREAGRLLLRQDADVTPKTIELATEAWINQQIVLRIPSTARSGVLTIERKDGRGSASTYLALLTLIENELTSTYPPFAFLGHTRNDGVHATALFSSQPNPPNYDNAVEHILDGQGLGTRYETIVEPSPLAATAGDLDTSSGQFAFIANMTGSDEINAWLITTSSASPNNNLRPQIASESDIESLSIRLLAAQSNTIPAVMAVSTSSVIKVGYVADLRSQNFPALTTVTSTQILTERVTLGRRAEGNAFQYLLAYREGGSAAGQLIIQTANGQGNGPGQFSRPNYASRPTAGDAIKILNVPNIGFVICYEERQAGGRYDIRLLKRTDYSSVGYAPFAATNFNRRLQDVGLVTRNGASYIAVAFTTIAGGSRLYYSEIAASEIAADGRGNNGIADLGFVAEISGEPTPQAKLSCQQQAASECSLAWLGQSAPSALFLRR